MARDLEHLRGKTVVIPRGTTVRSMNPSKRKYVTARAQRVTVHMVFDAQEISHYMITNGELARIRANPQFAHQIAAFEKVKFDYEFALELMRENEITDEDYRTVSRAYRDFRFQLSKPSVSWAGTGGYWCDAEDWIEE